MSFDLDAPAEIEFDLEPPPAETATEMPSGPGTTSVVAGRGIDPFESETQFEAEFEPQLELVEEVSEEIETIEELRFEESCASPPVAETFGGEPEEELTLGQPTRMRSIARCSRSRTICGRSRSRPASLTSRCRTSRQNRCWRA